MAISSSYMKLPEDTKDVAPSKWLLTRDHMGSPKMFFKLLWLQHSIPPRDTEISTSQFRFNKICIASVPLLPMMISWVKRPL